MSDDTSAPRAPSGTHDVMPPQSHRWEVLLATFASLAGRFGFSMVHTPLFEDVRVFHRGIGEASEVVGKEMYEFTDRGGRQLALRPEGTASIVRAFVQHRPATPWRAWYATPSFRYERPQAGRFRQHHQVGVEALGSPDPDVDVEVIVLAQRFFEALGLTN
ncbi:MAG: ATP phosphoribosyltransferase regulatory subunit, partial [Actinomycetes bacterium]